MVRKEREEERVEGLENGEWRRKGRQDEGGAGDERRVRADEKVEGKVWK